MKKILLLAILVGTTTAQADTYVQGHIRSNGTYVAPHMRSNADSTTSNNYSTQGNTNPYTGAEGHRASSYGGGYSGSSYQSVQPIQPIQPYGFGNR